MIDNGQAVDIKDISEKSLVKHLKKLFISLNLKENGDRVFLLPSKASPTLDVIGPLIQSYMHPANDRTEPSAALPETSAPAEQTVDDNSIEPPEDHSVGPRKRLVILFLDIFIYFFEVFFVKFLFSLQGDWSSYAVC
jgi:hypothetical protein